jgi:hypothetical protein
MPAALHLGEGARCGALSFCPVQGLGDGSGYVPHIQCRGDG